MLENLRYSVAGARDGMSWREDKIDRETARAQQQQAYEQGQQAYGMQLAEHEADRAQDIADREEFDLPEKRAKAEVMKTSQDTTKRNVRLMRAYAQAQRGDLTGLESFYSDEVPDGYQAKLVPMPDGRVEIQHPRGRAIANNLDEVVFGKEDGSGLGLYQMVNPEQAAESVVSGRQERTKRQQDIDDDTRQNAQRMREVKAQRQPMPQYGMDAEGNMGQIDGTSFRPVTGADGKPMRGGFGMNTRQQTEMDRRESAARQRLVQRVYMDVLNELRDATPDEQKAEIRRRLAEMQALSDVPPAEMPDEAGAINYGGPRSRGGARRGASIAPSGEQAATDIPEQAVAFLRANPGMRAAFDAKYGAGASASVLGQ